jgi:hypothetical protein
MGQFTIKNVPFIHARYGREITCTFGGTEMPEMTPPPHVNQRCTMTPMENKMSEIKTETYKSQVYQIDRPYLFLNTNKKWEFGYLTNIDSTSQFPFINHASENFSSIKCVPEFRCGMGTITPAPIELVNGAAYMFDCDDHSNVIGLFIKGGGLFLIHDGAVFNASACTNIRLMTVESKQ